MTLADTSVWIEHFRHGEPRLEEILRDSLVLMHPFVLGELACGNLKDRDVVLRDLDALPKALVATHEEAMKFVEMHAGRDRGIGWVDAHVLASSLLSRCQFWTVDKRLRRIAVQMGVAMRG